MAAKRGRDCRRLVLKWFRSRPWIFEHSIYVTLFLHTSSAAQIQAFKAWGRARRCYSTGHVATWGSPIVSIVVPFLGLPKSILKDPKR